MQLGVWMLSVAVFGPAANQPPESTLRPAGEAVIVRAGATCLTQELIASQLSAWLDGGLVDGRIRIEVVGDDAEPTVATMYVFEDDDLAAERSFRPGPATCENLAAVVALSAAMAIDATVLERVVDEPAQGSSPGPRPEPDPLSEPTPPPEPAPAETVVNDAGTPMAPEPEPTETRRVELRLALEATGHVGLVPRAGFGGLVRLELSRRWFGVRVGAGWAHAPAVPISPSTARLEVDMPSARVDFCGTGTRRIARIGGCIGAMGGPLLARAPTLPDTARAVSAWMALVAGAHLQLRFHERVGLSIDLDASVSLVRPTLELRGPTGEIGARRALPVGGLGVGVGPVFWLR